LFSRTLVYALPRIYKEIMKVCFLPTNVRSELAHRKFALFVISSTNANSEKAKS